MIVIMQKLSVPLKSYQCRVFGCHERAGMQNATCPAIHNPSSGDHTARIHLVSSGAPSS